MRKFDNIIQSETAPVTTSLWLHDDKLYYYNNGKWVQIIMDKPAETEPDPTNEVSEE